MINISYITVIVGYKFIHFGSVYMKVQFGNGIRLYQDGIYDVVAIVDGTCAMDF